MPARLTPDKVDKILKLHEDGWRPTEIANKVGVHVNTVLRKVKDGQRRDTHLDPDAKKGLDDFAFFRQHYLGRVNLPWHTHAAHRIVELLATPQREYLVINVPPGAGKSTLLMDTVKWCICRDRAVRVLYGSAVQATASDYSKAIMWDLTREDPSVATSNELAQGLAVDAQSTLQKAYGRFKPSNGDRWTKEKFTVAQAEGRATQNKEATVVAYGYDSGFLGGRYDLCIWDDLVTDKIMRTEESREKLIRWWENTAETRCEPGGLVVLNGQRLGGDDLYRHALDMLGVSEAELVSDELLITDDMPRKYHHIVFPAHHDDTCAGPTIEVNGEHLPNPDHALTGRPWPDGCLLDPRRLSWRYLAPLRRNEQNYSIVYQQQDTDVLNALARRIWIDGGVETVKNGSITHPGCLDRDRMMWQAPQMDGQTTAYVTVDPSPTRNWSIQFWIYHHLTERRILIAHHRGPLTAPAFLDYDQTIRTHVGLLEDWWQQAAKIGHPFHSVVIEDNAAQKFMLQTNSITTWGQKRNVRLVSHKTHGMNKADPEYGVRMLGPLYERGLIRLPWMGTEALKYSTYLINEVTKWPNATFEDCVMSQWFGEHQLRNIKSPDAKVYKFRRPSWVA